MNIYLTYMFVLAISFFTNCSPQHFYKSYWYDKENVRQGTFYDEDNDLVIKCMNDNKKLYLHIETKNVRTISKILTLGLSVWIDTKGKKKREYGIHYPLPDDNYLLDVNNIFDEEFTLSTAQSIPLPEISLVGFNNTKNPIRYRINELNNDLNANILILPEQTFACLLEISFSKMHVILNDLSQISIFYESTWVATPTYLSSMTAKEVILLKTSKYKAGKVRRGELFDRWIQISLAKQSK